MIADIRARLREAEGALRENLAALEAMNGDKIAHLQKIRELEARLAKERAKEGDLKKQQQAIKYLEMMLGKERAQADTLTSTLSSSNSQTAALEDRIGTLRNQYRVLERAAATPAEPAAARFSGAAAPVGGGARDYGGYPAGLPGPPPVAGVIQISERSAWAAVAVAVVAVALSTLAFSPDRLALRWRRARDARRPRAAAAAVGRAARAAFLAVRRDITSGDLQKLAARVLAVAAALVRAALAGLAGLHGRCHYGLQEARLWARQKRGGGAGVSRFAAKVLEESPLIDGKPTVLFLVDAQGLSLRQRSGKGRFGKPVDIPLRKLKQFGVHGARREQIWFQIRQSPKGEPESLKLYSKDAALICHAVQKLVRREIARRQRAEAQKTALKGALLAELKEVTQADQGRDPARAAAAAAGGGGGGESHPIDWLLDEGENSIGRKEQRQPQRAGRSAGSAAAVGSHVLSSADSSVSGPSESVSGGSPGGRTPQSRAPVHYSYPIVPGDVKVEDSPPEEPAACEDGLLSARAPVPDQPVPQCWRGAKAGRTGAGIGGKRQMQVPRRTRRSSKSPLERHEPRPPPHL